MKSAYFLMKSEYSEIPIKFDDLIARLRAFLRERLNRGEFSERSLARVLRVSQPHLHNMMKGVRQVNAGFADQVLLQFNISVLDLLADEELWNHMDRKNPDWMISAALRKPPGRANRIAREVVRRGGKES